ncbi:MAG: hypothetical protein KatS3mg131_3327 [Candidatus Tectimicrobiota bacterium]|nr:MAG: hypothetical protein KatS3mg131_3327 [Candidatus Tectomicrobia bacterium]
MPLTRRAFLLGALGAPTLSLAGSGWRRLLTLPRAEAAKVEPRGRVVLGWHTGISSAWLDPQEQPAMLTPTNFQYAVHDALIKNYHGQIAQPALAERWEMAPDFRSATFWLRPGIKFHNGDPVTPEDVKFTYENYRGAQADVFKAKTERVEIVDDRTVRFHFKAPFLDFPILFGTGASGAAWVVPAKYYQQVGPDGFKRQPIGAGPYRLVRQEPGVKLEFEAFPDYYRPVHVKQLVMVGVTEPFTRVAMLERGEADIIYLVPGELIARVRSLPGVLLAPTLAGPFWMEMPGFEDPASPFHDRRVRQAISLALNRRALSEAETAGFAPPLGNWIPHNWPGAIEWPEFPYDPQQAKQLLADAGYANGLDLDWFVPFPPYFSLGERIISQLREVGIRTKMRTMERGTFFSLLRGGPAGVSGYPAGADRLGDPRRLGGALPGVFPMRRVVFAVVRARAGRQVRALRGLGRPCRAPAPGRRHPADDSGKLLRYSRIPAGVYQRHRPTYCGAEVAGRLFY